MSTAVTWPNPGGSSYSIPAVNELNWEALSDFLIALGTNGAATTVAKQAVRKATTTPITISASADFLVVSKLAVPAAVAVSLPAGTAGKMYAVLDGTGDASSNNITITPSGADTINGAASLVMSHDKEAILLAYDLADTNWVVLSRLLPDWLTPAGSAVLTNKTINGASNTLTVRAASDITGFLPIANGGTGPSLLLPVANGGSGQTTANAALNAFLPSQTANGGKVLQTDGSNTSWAVSGGNKQYLVGTAYTNGTPAIANVSAFTTVTNVRSTLIPYQASGGEWRLRATIVFTSGSNVSGGTFSISGVTFKNVSNYIQPVFGYENANPGVFTGKCINNTGNILVIFANAGSGTGPWSVGLDVELDSKPTWAD